MIMPNVLIVEDSAGKLGAIRSILDAVCPGVSITHAATMIEAERAIERPDWSLVVLDISMDIAPSQLGPRSRGQANIGGLSIAQRMFLLEMECPTIIVTAFDSFSASGNASSIAEIVGFEEVRTRAEGFLGSNLIGCYQYNSTTWREEMASVVKDIFQ